MDRLIYTSLTAMRGSMARQTAIANNLANVQTPGFRGEMAEAQSLWLHGAGFDARAMASEEVVGADMRAGTIAATGRDLDIAMQGDAMLVVQAPDGEQAYTRRGDLQLSPSGLLTTGDNHPVQGAQGPITLPPADSVKIDAEGRIWVVPAGGDPENPQEIDRLRLATPRGRRSSRDSTACSACAAAASCPTIRRRASSPVRSKDRTSPPPPRSSR